MNPDIKNQWLSALRSGEYLQTRGVLHRVASGPSGQSVGHCCLGVLCDLAVKAGVVEEVVVDGPDLVGYSAGSRVEMYVLPVEVQEWAGLKSDRGLRTPEAPLTSFNDSGKTFAEIADLIEEHA